MTELAVDLYGQRIGVITGDSFRTFDITIDDGAIARFGASSQILSMAVPLDVRQNRGHAKRRRNFFAGLLPEGNQLTHMARGARLQEFDTLGLLARYGRDVAGAVQVWDLQDPDEPLTPTFEPVTDGGIRAMLEDLSGQPLGNSWTRGKTSLGGVQPKIVLARTDDGWARVENGYPSTHIVKPVVTDYPTMIYDEEYGSRFARGLDLASFSTQLHAFDGADALVIERYDRDPTSPTGRIHQEDLAQALGVPTGEKYERHGAVTLQRIAKRLDETHERNARYKLLRMVTLSAAIGNLDMHAKNISVLHPENGPMTVAPMYDVVPQTQYDNDGELALSVNGVFAHNDITADDIEAVVGSWGWRGARRFINDTLEQVREIARAETPHESAEPSLQSEILRFTQNLLDGRPAGAWPDKTTIGMAGP